MHCVYSFSIFLNMLEGNQGLEEGKMKFQAAFFFSISEIETEMRLPPLLEGPASVFPST